MSLALPFHKAKRSFLQLVHHISRDVCFRCLGTSDAGEHWRRDAFQQAFYPIKPLLDSSFCQIPLIFNKIFISILPITGNINIKHLTNSKTMVMGSS